MLQMYIENCFSKNDIYYTFQYLLFDLPEKLVNIKYHSPFKTFSYEKINIYFCFHRAFGGNFLCKRLAMRMYRRHLYKRGRNVSKHKTTGRKKSMWRQGKRFKNLKLQYQL